MIALLTQWKWLAAGGGAAAMLGLVALWRLEAGHAARLQSELQTAQAAQAGAAVDAAATSDAEAVIAGGAVRDQQTLAIHAENSHALTAASGSGQSLDPDLNAAGRRGLCGYAAYAADPACVQLRGTDPGQRPQAGGADSPAAP